MAPKLSMYDKGMYFYQSEDVPCKIVQDFLKDLLGEEFIVKLRVMDPRMRPFDCYGKLTKEMKEKLKELYPSYKEINKGISFSPGDHVFISIYNVKGIISKIKVKRSDKKYNKGLEDSRREMF